MAGTVYKTSHFHFSIIHPPQNRQTQNIISKTVAAVAKCLERDFVNISAVLLSDHSGLSVVVHDPSGEAVK